VCGNHTREVVKLNNSQKCLTAEREIHVASGAEMMSFFRSARISSCAAVKPAVHESAELCFTPPIGQNIRRLRLANGITQRQLAYKLRVSMQAVSKWEREQAYPDLTLLVPIARFFGVTLDELFGCE